MSDEKIARALRLRMEAIGHEISVRCEACEELYELWQEWMDEALDLAAERAKLRQAWETVCFRMLAAAQPAEQCLDLDEADNAGGIVPLARGKVPHQVQPGSAR
ncbi:MAG TPA: hypothetical protein VFI48_16415 [Hyphomicrobiaceae bacterium]|nr:hypothetical protein [Hyphomicrobiaceae bacterium]